MEFGQFEVLKIEKQNQEYEGMIIKSEEMGIKIRSRLAKKTPKKEGYFVTFWEKDESGENQAFSYEEIAMLVVVVVDGEKQGFFAFPKKVLIDKGIAKAENKNGKMAMRVYPEWSQDLNKAAQRTQKWQKDYFYSLEREIG